MTYSIQARSREKRCSGFDPMEDTESFEHVERFPPFVWLQWVRSDGGY